MNSCYSQGAWNDSNYSTNETESLSNQLLKVSNYTEFELGKEWTRLFTSCATDQAFNLLQTGSISYFIDTRDADDYIDSHIKTSINIPHNSSNIDKFNLYPNILSLNDFLDQKATISNALILKHIVFIPSFKFDINAVLSSNKFSTKEETFMKHCIKIALIMMDELIEDSSSNVHKYIYDETKQMSFIFYMMNEAFRTFKKEFPFVCVASQKIIETKTKLETETQTQASGKTSNMNISSNNSNNTKMLENIGGGSDLYGTDEYNNDKLKKMKSIVSIEKRASGDYYPNIILKNKLYLGDRYDSRNINVMKNLGISHVVNCTKEMNPFEYDNENNLFIKYCNIRVTDEASSPIHVYFKFACTFIDSALNQLNSQKKSTGTAVGAVGAVGAAADNNENKQSEADKDSDGNNGNGDNAYGGKKSNVVFVHCAAGVSRSSTIIICYLMYRNKWSFEQSYNWVKKCRPIIDPNSGFRQCLQSWELHLLQFDTINYKLIGNINVFNLVDEISLCQFYNFIDNAMIIDIRSSNEFEKIHIKNSINIESKNRKKDDVDASSNVDEKKESKENKENKENNNSDASPVITGAFPWDYYVDHHNMIQSVMKMNKQKGGKTRLINCGLLKDYNCLIRAPKEYQIAQQIRDFMYNKIMYQLRDVKKIIFVSTQLRKKKPNDDNEFEAKTTSNQASQVKQSQKKVEHVQDSNIKKHESIEHEHVCELVTFFENNLFTEAMRKPKYCIVNGLNIKQFCGQFKFLSEGTEIAEQLGDENNGKKLSPSPGAVNNNDNGYGAYGYNFNSNSANNGYNNDNLDDDDDDEYDSISQLYFKNDYPMMIFENKLYWGDWMSVTKRGDTIMKQLGITHVIECIGHNDNLKDKNKNGNENNKDVVGQVTKVEIDFGFIENKDLDDEGFDNVKSKFDAEMNRGEKELIHCVSMFDKLATQGDKKNVILITGKMTKQLECLCIVMVCVMKRNKMSFKQCCQWLKKRNIEIEIEEDAQALVNRCVI